MPERARHVTGIGSSQIAALVGLHPYRDVFDVFNELALGVQGKRRDYLDFGNDLEPAILAFRQRQLGAGRWTEERFRNVYGPLHLGGNTVRSSESRIAVASCDAVFDLPFNESDDPCEQVEESKAVGYHESWEWGDGDEQFPAGYRIQNLWQQGVLAIPRGEVVASIAGAAPAAWPVLFDRAFYGNLVVIAERFWRDHVLTKKPPRPIDGSEAARAYLRARYPEDTEPMAYPCPPDVEALALEWDELKPWVKAFETREDDLKNRICDRIAEKTGWVLSDQRWLTWAAQNTSHGGRTRVLRIQKEKRKRS